MVLVTLQVVSTYLTKEGCDIQLASQEDLLSRPASCLDILGSVQRPINPYDPSILLDQEKHQFCDIPGRYVDRVIIVSTRTSYCYTVTNKCLKLSRCIYVTTI